MLLGMAYKPDIDDLRESPALDVWALLEREWGVSVCYHDPYVDEIKSLGATSTPLSAESLAQVDAVVVTTNHKSIDYDLVLAHAPLVLDTRNAIKAAVDNVVRL
jgi:UDP-N-acetyl-D-glucosamine dehydrogenase